MIDTAFRTQSTVIRRGRLAIVLLAAALPLSFNYASAAYMVIGGNDPQIDENVLNGNSQVGSTIQAALNQTGDIVTFTSPSQTLVAPANGQARVEAVNANLQVDINDAITVAFLNTNLRFKTLIFNATDGTGSLTLNITGFNPDNSPANASISLTTGNNPLSLGSGSNFYSLIATGGMVMASVEIDTNANTTYTDLRQVRIGGVVPEPGAAFLSSVAMAAVAVRRRRRYPRPSFYPPPAR